MPAADLQGAPSYFAFAVAGILVSLVVASATAEIAGRVRDEQLTGTLELLCAQPRAQRAALLRLPPPSRSPTRSSASPSTS